VQTREIVAYLVGNHPCHPHRALGGLCRAAVS